MPSAPPPAGEDNAEDFSNLPNVPLDLPDVPSTNDTNLNDKADNDDIDFDYLSKRFEELKKKK